MWHEKNKHIFLFIWHLKKKDVDPSPGHSIDLDAIGLTLVFFFLSPMVYPSTFKLTVNKMYACL